MIEQIYNKNKRTIRWENVWNIKEFGTLEKVQQNTEWHGEGYVSIHTVMTVNAMTEKMKNVKDDTLVEIMLLSALFHDIGKGVATFFNIERNNWSSKNHSEYGEFITRKLLWDENPMIRESVCYFVRNHMKPLYIANSSTVIRDLITLSCDTIYPQYCNVSNLILLKECDCLGAIFEYNKWDEKLKGLKETAQIIGCYDKPYEFTNEMSKYQYFNDSFDTFPNPTKDNAEFEVFIKIGDPNVDKLETTLGKDFQTTLDTETDIADNIVENCEKSISFVLDYNDLDEDLWEMALNVIYLHRGKITFVYGSNKYTNYLSPNMCMSFINAN